MGDFLKWGSGSIWLTVGLEKPHCACPASWEEERVGGSLASLRALQDLLTSLSLVRYVRHSRPFMVLIEILSVTDMSGERCLCPSRKPWIEACQLLGGTSRSTRRYSADRTGHALHGILCLLARPVHVRGSVILQLGIHV